MHYSSLIRELEIEARKPRKLEASVIQKMEKFFATFSVFLLERKESVVYIKFLTVSIRQILI